MEPDQARVAVPVPGEMELTPAPPFAVVEILECCRRVGESLYETAERVITEELLHRTGGNQAKASRMARITPRVMNYKCENLNRRPKDRR